MRCKSKAPLNGQRFDKGTTCKTDHPARAPAGSRKSAAIQKADLKVNKAVHGLVINLLPHPTNPMQWGDSVLVQALLKDNIFEDILKSYANKVMDGSIEFGGGSSSLKHEFVKKSPGQLAAETAKPIFKKRVMETTAVQKVQAAFGDLGKVYASEIRQVFINKDYSKMFVVVASGVTIAGGVAGFAQVAKETKNDTLASGITELANGLIPEKLYEVGGLKLQGYSVVVGQSGFSWTPSNGKWKSSAYVATEWLPKKNVHLKGRIELLANETGTNAKVDAGATYSIGEVYLDAIEASGTASSAGNYELLLQFKRTIPASSDTKFEAFVGAKYRGRYSGDPAADEKTGFAGTAGFRLKFN